MVLPRYYSKKHLKGIRELREQMQAKTDNLVINFVHFPFAREKALEYARQGFVRRIQLLNRCIQNLFKAIPAGSVKVPTRNRRHDAEINLHAFFANAYGCVDNLAWIWVHERGLRSKLKRGEVGIRQHNTKVRRTFSPEYRAFLKTREDWFSYLVEFRDALAHRVPPYIPPGSVRRKDVDAYNALERRMNKAAAEVNSAEYGRLLEAQMRLYVFQPVTTHSLVEATGTIRFHPQVLVDFLTVEEMATKMLEELRRPRPRS